MRERPGDWAQVGQLVLSRRLELGYRSQQALATACGLSLRTIGDVELGRRGGHLSASTLAALELVLGWRTGGCTTAAAGGLPALVTPVLPMPRPGGR